MEHTVTLLVDALMDDVRGTDGKHGYYTSACNLDLSLRCDSTKARTLRKCHAEVLLLRLRTVQWVGRFLRTKSKVQNCFAVGL